MGVGFAESRVGDAHKFTVFLHVGDGLAAGVTHGGFQATNQLMHYACDRAFEAGWEVAHDGWEFEL